ncbi:hypothetical protein HZC53_02130 [Candidatus Uhrbacteria bacterium]|nr:hypothetical protein [Candidatus Uhrbacteria bacterium]
MGKRLKNLSKTNVPVLLFATFLVVGGIVSAAYFSSQKADVAAQASKQGSVQNSTSQPQVASGTLWLANSDAVTVLKFDGTSERLSWDDFAKRFPSAVWPGQGSLAANGSAVSLLSPEQASGTRKIYPSPDRRYMANLGTPKSDNAAVIEVRQGRESPQTLVIRDRKGRAFSDTQFMGWLDNRTLALTAVATSSRWVYAVDLNNVMRPLAPLPDDAVYLEVRAGAVWYATAVLGEGIESPPMGPSDLHRITSNGQDVIVAQDDSRVFQIVVANDRGDFMYATDDGQAYYQKSGDTGSRKALSERRPLLILRDGRLVLREGFKVVLYDPATSLSRDLGDLPEGEVRVFEGS